MIEKLKPEPAIQSSKDASKIIIEITGMHKWFGTFHDGTPEAHARMTKRWGEKRDPAQP